MHDIAMTSPHFVSNLLNEGQPWQKSCNRLNFFNNPFSFNDHVNKIILIKTKKVQQSAQKSIQGVDSIGAKRQQKTNQKHRKTHRPFAAHLQPTRSKNPVRNDIYPNYTHYQGHKLNIILLNFKYKIIILHLKFSKYIFKLKWMYSLLWQATAFT